MATLALPEHSTGSTLAYGLATPPTYSGRGGKMLDKEKFFDLKASTESDCLMSAGRSGNKVEILLFQQITKARAHSLFFYYSDIENKFRNV